MTIQFTSPIIHVNIFASTYEIGVYMNICGSDHVMHDICQKIASLYPISRLPMYK